MSKVLTDNVLAKSIYHLSHTDLDGYGCQFITNQIFSDIQFYNANYNEIDEFLDKIIEDMNKNSLLLITDLNLTIVQSMYLDEKSKELDFDILLIDHHVTGMDSSNKYDWYNLCTDNCATYLTFEYFKYKIEDPSTKDIVDFINTYDMWRKENTLQFNKATLMSDIIFKYKLDSTKNVFLKIKMIYFIGNALIDDDVLTVESKIPSVLTNTLLSLTSDPELQEIMLDKNICSSYKMSVHPANDLVPFYSSMFKGKDVIFYKGISSSTFQYSSDFLLNKSTYDDCILVNINAKNGNMSLRSRNQLANQLALVFGGGGHPDAAGANIPLDDREIQEILKKDYNI